MEHAPWDFEHGLNFYVKKTKKGEYANYDTSKWARKESALTDSQTAAMDQFGLSNLVDFIPNQPTSEQKDVMFDMFEASVDGKAYDPERWAEYYRPHGVDKPGSDTNRSESTPAPTKSVEVADDDTPPFDTNDDDVQAPKKSSNDDIMAMINARKKA